MEELGLAPVTDINRHHTVATGILVDIGTSVVHTEEEVTGVEVAIIVDEGSLAGSSQLNILGFIELPGFFIRGNF
jgi:hypothetical protein